MIGNPQSKTSIKKSFSFLINDDVNKYSIILIFILKYFYKYIIIKINIKNY